MLISAIVPVYNVEPYLKKCVDSLLSQTFEDFEIILVDDGSVDNSGKICDQYLEIDNRISVIHKANGGLSDARNAGLKIARGDFVFFVDSDDYIEPDTFMTVVPSLNDDYQMIVLPFFLEYENGDTKLIFRGEFDKKSFTKKEDKLKFLCNELTDYRVAWNAWGKFFRLSTIKKYEIFFEDNKQIFAEDLYYCLCYFVFINSVVNLNKPLYHYVIRNNSIMGLDSKIINIGRFDNLARALHTFYSKHSECTYFKRHFSAIYYKIIHHAIIVDKKATNINGFYQFRQIFNDNISNKKFLKSSKRRIWFNIRYLYNDYYSKRLILTGVNEFLFYCDGCFFVYKVRDKVINVLFGKK